MLRPIGRLGDWTARRLSRLGALARFGFGALRAGIALTAAGRAVALRVALNQIRFTALHAVGLVLLPAGILSFLVISQAVRELGRLGVTEFIGTLIVVAIVRELGPLITALAVAGRSGTAIAAELATNRVMGEVRAPRLAAGLVSVFTLLILFDLGAIGAGFAAARLAGMSGERYFDVVLQSLAARDVWLTVVKALAFGLIVGLVPCYFGLAVRGSPTEIPVAASRATVSAIVGIFLCAALLTAVD